MQAFPPHLRSERLLRSMRHLAAISASVVCVPAAVLAQRATTAVRIRVVDSASTPVAGASVTIVRGLQDLVSQGGTDAEGFRTLIVDRDDEPAQVVVRKIGYARGSQFFVPKGDTISLRLTVHRAVQTLAPVTINAIEDIKRKAYHVDADEIANSKRPIFDGMDVLTKLKPDILYGRSPGCAVQEVFVNGKRIIYPPPNDMALARKPQASSPGMRSGSGRPLPSSPLASVSDDIWWIMSTIKPEHIDEMNFEECASVIDAATGTYARTTATGTVALAFLPRGRSTVRITKAGYADQTLDVSIAPRDTVPITIILVPIK